MSVPIIDVSRREVERWLSAGTLGNGPMNKNFDFDYYVVALCARFNGNSNTDWVPWVVDTIYGGYEAERTASVLDVEIINLEFISCPVTCFEIWHLVDKVYYADDEDTDDLYAHAIQILSLCPDLFPQPHTIFDDAWTVMQWYEEQFCVPEGTFPWWYPASAIARVQNLKDLNELRLASVADKQNAMVSYCAEHVMSSDSEDIPF